MKLWVFSDLHLDESDLYREFVSVLRARVQPADVVVLAGDIFDLMVGKSRHFQQKYAEFFSTLHELDERRVQLHYIFGNHDFNLFKAFGTTQVLVHDEHVALTAPAPDGFKKIYIAHGDLVDQSDVNYLRMRKLFRSLPVKALTTMIPGSWVEAFGRTLSRKSDQKAADLPESWPAHQRNALRNLYRSFAAEKRRQGYDLVVLGHCHDLDEHPPFYWNMGYPPVHRQFLVYDSETGTFSRDQFVGIPRQN